MVTRFKRGFFVAALATIFSCSNDRIAQSSSAQTDVDSSKVLFQKAFEMASFRQEAYLIDMKYVKYIGDSDSVGLKSMVSLREDYYNSKLQLEDEFIDLTKFGTREWPLLDKYIANTICNYLEHNLERQYFIEKKPTILHHCLQNKTFRTEVINPKDSTESFWMRSQTLEVLNEINIDSSSLSFNNLQRVNIFVAALSDYEYFPCFMQGKVKNCGPACLKTVADYYNTFFTISAIEKFTGLDSLGTTTKGLKQGAEAMGYIADAQVVDFSSLSNEMQLPVIAYWKESHFVVVYEIGLDYVKFADPAVGSRRLSHENFCKHWLLEDGKTATQGKVLTLFPNRP